MINTIVTVGKINELIDKVEQAPLSLECMNAVIDMLRYEIECIYNKTKK